MSFQPTHWLLLLPEPEECGQGTQKAKNPIMCKPGLKARINLQEASCFYGSFATTKLSCSLAYPNIRSAFPNRPTRETLEVGNIFKWPQHAQLALASRTRAILWDFLLHLLSSVISQRPWLLSTHWGRLSSVLGCSRSLVYLLVCSCLLCSGDSRCNTREQVDKMLLSAVYKSCGRVAADDPWATQHMQGNSVTLDLELK